MKSTVAVIGGGAAGFFGAIACASATGKRVILLEKTRQLLTKVKISGGGRCNVTHACFDPAELIKNYPRGGKELRGAFARFQPRDTIAWFAAHGVALKEESDGRMFPVTDNSETIVACLMQQARQAGVEILLERAVVDCDRHQGQFVLTFSDGDTLTCDGLLVAAGGNSKVHTWLEKLGHTFIPGVPSLFTVNIPDSPLNDLAGISVPFVKVSIENSLEEVGPLLITHWGFSGPVILKLSAWGARDLHRCHYRAMLKINWLPQYNEAELKAFLEQYRREHPARLVASEAPFQLPKNLWKALLEMATISREVRWAVLSKQQLQHLLLILQASTFQINGKSTYKEEFVTCGGVKLSEVDFKTMQSKICPGLYFAGEVLDIDGVTGGFNFQNAWTTGWLAGNALAER